MKIKRLYYKIISPFRKAYWFIFRPKTLGVKCLIEHDGRFLTIRNTYGLKQWTFPGGGVNKGESSEDAATREAFEEVAIKLSLPSFIGEYQSTKQYKRDTVHCFYAKAESDYFKIDHDEVSEAAWLAPSEIPANQSFAVGKILNLYGLFVGTGK